jgi:hypothetical protein
MYLKNWRKKTACEFALECEVQFNLREFKINFCTGICKKLATVIVIKL